jgi:DNA mismatch endonuclease (patch repair protein)
MSRVRSKNTEPEILVRRQLRSLGVGYRLHVRSLAGTPDIVFIGRRCVIFVHGCFWHRHEGCRLATSPKTNTEFWKAKFAANVARDANDVKCLEEKGWRVLVIWQCEAQSVRLVERLQHFLGLGTSVAANDA